MSQFHVEKVIRIRLNVYTKQSIWSNEQCVNFGFDFIEYAAFWLAVISIDNHNKKKISINFSPFRTFFWKMSK